MRAFIECGLCGGQSEVGVGESPERAAKRHRMSEAKLNIYDGHGNLKTHEIYICRSCASAIVAGAIKVKKASKSNIYSSHIYLPQTWTEKTVVAIKKGD